MKICFVLDRPELGGGVKVVFQLAGILHGLGHEVVVLGRGARPSWSERWLSGGYRDTDTEAEPDSCGEFDVVIGTYFTTMERAMAIGARHTVHLCQGFEGDLEHLAVQRQKIDAAYALPVPIITVNPALGRRLAAMFGKRWYFVPPPIDDIFRPQIRWRPHRRPLISVPGVFEAPVKGVRQCIEAIGLLRSGGWEVETFRFSTLPLCDEERELHRRNYYFHSISPESLARELRRCDLLLFGSLPGDGFGLPVLEAAASGVPVVGNDLPALRLIGVGTDQRVTVESATAMAGAAADLLRDHAGWRAARGKLIRRARARFGAEAVGRRLVEALGNIMEDEM